jgi:hypothetical protein
MLQKLKTLWASLPHPVQALILLFATTAGTTLGKELQELLLGNEAFTWAVLQHDLVVAVLAGAAVVRAFYMLPNASGKQLQANAQQSVSPAPGK